jgi:pimeloyl-ACP methyl ester carboxylesterase
MGSFVLVHGTSCGGWIWQKVSPLLRAAGHDVYAPTLSGLSDRSHLVNYGVDLHTHVTDVANLLSYEDLSDVVLVGHSYAGMVITGVAARVPERLKLLVYLDAYVPDDGQSEVELWTADMRAAIQSDPAAARGFRQPPPLDFLGVTDGEMAAWLQARLTPQPMSTYTQPVPAGDARSHALPRVFIHCTAGQTSQLFGTFAIKARARGWPVHEIATGHMVMLTRPRELATILLESAVSGR